MSDEGARPPVKEAIISGFMKRSFAEKNSERVGEMRKLPVTLATGRTIRLSPGEHSKLIKAIIEEFAPRFVPGGVLIDAGDTGEKWGYFDNELLAKLGVGVDDHGKMPDVVLYCPKRGWLLLVESVTSHGPVDAKRHDALARSGGGHRTIPNAWFVGMAPRRNPDIVVAVLWENGNWGNNSAKLGAQVIDTFVEKQRKRDNNIRRLRPLHAQQTVVRRSVHDLHFVGDDELFQPFRDFPR